MVGTVLSEHLLNCAVLNMASGGAGKGLKDVLVLGNTVGEVETFAEDTIQYELAPGNTVGECIGAKAFAEDTIENELAPDNIVGEGIGPKAFVPGRGYSCDWFVNGVSRNCIHDRGNAVRDAGSANSKGRCTETWRSFFLLEV